MPDVWEIIEGTESYAAESLVTEGFVHCSYIGQLKGVIDRYYSAEESLVILEIDPDLLKSELKVEKSTGDELFPHIYGPINMDSVVSVSLRNNHEVQDAGAEFVN